MLKEFSSIARLPNRHTVLDAISLVSRQNKKGLIKQVNARLQRKMITDVPSSFKITKQVIIQVLRKRMNPESSMFREFSFTKDNFST